MSENKGGKSDTILGHGIPDGAVEAEPTGPPTSDRHHSETSAHDSGGSEHASKHSYTGEAEKPGE